MIGEGGVLRRSALTCAPSTTKERNEQMAQSTSGLECFLAAMEFPATRDDLVREASRDGLGLQEVAALRALPDGSYDARCRVRDALAAVASDRRLLAA